MPHARAFTFMIESNHRRRRRSLASPEEDKLKEELSKVKSPLALNPPRPSGSSFFRIRRKRPILQTQFSNIEEECEIFVFLRLQCLEVLSDFEFTTRDISFPSDQKLTFGGGNQPQFDSSTSGSLSSLKKNDSSANGRIDFDCSFLSGEHAQLWFDEDQQVLCTGFPNSSQHDISVDEVRVHSGGLYSENDYESLKNPSELDMNHEGSPTNRRICIRSGDVVTLLSTKKDSPNASVTFRLYYRTGEESYKDTWCSIGAKTEAINHKIDRLLNLDDDESKRVPSSFAVVKEEENILLKKRNVIVFLLPVFIFLLLFVFFGETNTRLDTF